MYFGMNNWNLFEPKFPLAASVSVHIFAIMLTLLFGSYHMLYESIFVGICCFVALMFATCSLFASLNRADTSIFLIGFLVSIAALTTLASFLYGERGLIYCFSFPAALFFMMTFRAALIAGAAMCVINLIGAFPHMEFPLFVRFTVAIAMTYALSATFARQVYKQHTLLEKEANEDYLTGLMNQRCFYSWLGEFLSNPISKDKNLTIYYFDIDDFKSINDSFGHEGGDRVLKEFADRITYAAENLDLEFCFDPIIHFSRLSGDEFVLACPNTKNRDEAGKVASKFQEVLANPFSIGGRKVKINSSMGIHHFQVKQQDVSYVMRAADQAMYEAKKSGKQQFYISIGEPEFYDKGEFALN